MIFFDSKILLKEKILSVYKIEKYFSNIHESERFNSVN